MRILFVTENLSGRCGANVNIVMTLVKRLKNSNEVFALTRFDEGKPLDNQKIAQFRDVVTFQCDEMGYINAIQNRYNWRNISGIKRMFVLLSHPKALAYMLDAKYNDFWFSRRKYKKELERICTTQKFDAVIGVTAPYYIARAVADAKINCAKTVFQLDPYTYNYTLPKRQIKSRARLEAKLIERLDILFAASFVKDEIYNKGISSQNDKIVSFKHPGILVDIVPAAEVAEEKKDNDSICFMFIGQFYEVIRNPEFLLKLFQQLPENYELHLVGGGAEAVVKAYQEKLGDRLIRHGWVSSAEAARKMKEADVLVNLNNTITNQLASKIFEYISTGKPILNICKMEKCLSLEYTRHYENCLDILETQEIDEALLHRIKQFVVQRRNTIVERSKILEVYRENTDVYVAGLLNNKLIELTARRGCENDKK